MHTHVYELDSVLVVELPNVCGATSLTTLHMSLTSLLSVMCCKLSKLVQCAYNQVTNYSHVYIYIYIYIYNYIYIYIYVLHFVEMSWVEC